MPFGLYHFPHKNEQISKGNEQGKYIEYAKGQRNFSIGLDPREHRVVHSADFQLWER